MSSTQNIMSPAVISLTSISSDNDTSWSFTALYATAAEEGRIAGMPSTDLKIAQSGGGSPISDMYGSPADRIVDSIDWINYAAFMRFFAALVSTLSTRERLDV